MTFARINKAEIPSDIDLVNELDVAGMDVKSVRDRSLSKFYFSKLDFFQVHSWPERLQGDSDAFEVGSGPCDFPADPQGCQTVGEKSGPLQQHSRISGRLLLGCAGRQNLPRVQGREVVRKDGLQLFQALFDLGVAATSSVTVPAAQIYFLSLILFFFQVALVDYRSHPQPSRDHYSTAVGPNGYTSNSVVYFQL